MVIDVMKKHSSQDRDSEICCSKLIWTIVSRCDAVYQNVPGAQLEVKLNPACSAPAPLEFQVKKFEITTVC